MVIKDLGNSYSKDLFESNQLNIISDERAIEETLLSNMRNQGHNVTYLRNPEMIYRTFNFIKPSNLLPEYNNNLSLIKQLGENELGEQTNYVINPFFFGFKISFDIYITSLFCLDSDDSIEDGLVKILSDKYGKEFNDIYKYVANTSKKYTIEGRENGDQEDETFIAGLKTISGINSLDIFHHFIYETAVITASEKAKILKGEN